MGRVGSYNLRVALDINNKYGDEILSILNLGEAYFYIREVF